MTRHLSRRSMLAAMAATSAGALLAPVVTRSQPAAAAATWDEARMISMLNHPDAATFASYGTHDSAGNSMDGASVLQLAAGAAYRYACVYHTALAVNGGYRYQVHLSGSNDLMSWTHVRMLVDNADMPRLHRVDGASWIMLAHEQWRGSGQPSSAPCNVAFELFYTDADLLAGNIASTWLMPSYGSSNLNGTPNVYNASLTYDGTYYAVGGQYGFHNWNGSRDVNDVTTINQLFNPRGTVAAYPSTATTYNNKFIAAGVSGNIGQREAISPSFGGRYNLQEGNVGRPAADFADWRIWLYKFSETTSYPTGAGTVSTLNPVTPHASASFGNPFIRVLDAPSGNGQVLWVSYFLFGEGVGDPSEAGSLTYWTTI